MSPAPRAGWIAAAESLFNASLYLYPTRLREQHGVEMRQVFLDRCREVEEGRQSRARFLFELIPDTLASAASAQWELGVGEQRRWHYFAMVILLLSLVLLAFQDTVSTRLLDWTFRARYAYFSAQTARALAEEEQQVRGLADRLAVEPSAASKAQAAYLYRGLYRANLTYSVAAESAMEVIMAARAIDGRYVPIEGDREYFGAIAADGDRATASVNGTNEAGREGWIAAAAVLSCLPQAGCDVRRTLARLLAVEPDNAYGWSLQFKYSMAAHDDNGARKALSAMAASRYYDNHLEEIHRQIFASSLRLLREDSESRAAVARRVADNVYIGTDDFADDVRLQCSLQDRGELPPSWAIVHPESEADCVRAASLLASSKSQFDVWRGWAMLAERDSSTATGAALEQARQRYIASATGIGSTRNGSGRGWIPWTTAQWNEWAYKQSRRE